MVRLRVVHARWVVPMSETAEAVAQSPNGQKSFLEHHTVAVDADTGRIAHVLPTADARERFAASTDDTIESELDLSANSVLMPGLVNSHCHAAMVLFRGFGSGAALQAWLSHYVWPAEAEWATREFVRSGSMLAAGEMLRCGVTTVNDMYFFPEESAAGLVEAAGMRAVLAGPILQFPSPYAASPDEYMAKALEFEEQFRDNPLVTTCFGPHAPYTVSDAEFVRIAEESLRLGLRVHTHLHETETEITDHVASEDHDGMRPFARLQRLGLVNDRLIAAHMTQTTDAEIQAAAAAGMHVCHCPESNMKLRSGTCSVAKLTRAGVNVCLGTDGAASNDDLDMFGELRTAALVDKMHADSPLSAYEWLQIATINGARALGLDGKIGTLEPGKEADMIAVEMVQPVYNPVANLVTVGTNQVKHVWVAGRQVVEDSVVTSLPAGQLTEEARRWEKQISEWDRERKTVPTNALRDAIERGRSSPTPPREVTEELEQV
jgi:5-methylthioadenosine/S-adenosylhomocysteine deaminase